jgi:hypothetical protein
MHFAALPLRPLFAARSRICRFVEERPVFPLVSAAQVLIGFVHRHAVEPAVKPAPASVFADLPEDVEEDLLRHVCRVVEPHHPNH